MASLSGEKTLAELSAEFGVHPTMISNWKQELVKRAGELFGRGSTAPAAEPAGRGRGQGEGGRRAEAWRHPLTLPSRSLSSGRTSRGPGGDGSLPLPPEGRRG